MGFEDWYEWVPITQEKDKENDNWYFEQNNGRNKLLNEIFLNQDFKKLMLERFSWLTDSVENDEENMKDFFRATSQDFKEWLLAMIQTWEYKYWTVIIKINNNPEIAILKLLNPKKLVLSGLNKELNLNKFEKLNELHLGSDEVLNNIKGIPSSVKYVNCSKSSNRKRTIWEIKRLTSWRKDITIVVNWYEYKWWNETKLEPENKKTIEEDIKSWLERLVDSLSQKADDISDFLSELWDDFHDIVTPDFRNKYSKWKEKNPDKWPIDYLMEDIDLLSTSEKEIERKRRNLERRKK